MQDEIQNMTDSATQVSAKSRKQQTPEQIRNAKYSRDYYKRKQKSKRKEYDAAVLAFQEDQELKKQQEVDATKPLSDAEAEKVLRNERGLQHPHIIETVIRLAQVASEVNGRVFDRQFLIEGFAKDDPAASQVSDEQAKGMVITTRDLFALYDFGISWRKLIWPLKSFDEFKDIPWDFSALIAKKGETLTFDEFHGLRYCSITNSLWAGRWIHAKDFHSQPHGEWEAFFPKKIPSLPMDYGTEEIKIWFSGLTTGPRRFLLIASRNTYKSTWQTLCEAIGYVLACPDVTILEISAVKSLSKKFVKAFRQYWTVYNSRRPNLFQMLWPEMMIYADEKLDSTVFDCPMRKGLYPQSTMASTSADSSQVGERFLIGVADDAADEENEGTDELKENLVEKMELVEKLKEPVGFMFYIGTPKAAEGDLYKVLLDRSAKNNHKYLKFLRHPAWTVKPEAIRKNIYDLTENDVEILFPSRLGFDALYAELSNGSEAVFRRENLCEWVDNDDPNLKLHFSRAEIESTIINENEVPFGGEVYLTCDFGFTASTRRDPSCFTLHKTVKKTIYIYTQSAGFWNDSGKASEIVRLVRECPSSGTFLKCLLERYAAYEGLDKEIQLEAMRHGQTVPLFWFPTDQTPNAKFRRLKHNLERAFATGRIKLVRPKEGMPNWVEELIGELTQLDSTDATRRSTPSRRDDRGDSLAHAVRFFLTDNEEEPESEELTALREAQEAAEARRRQYARIFGMAPGQDYAPPQSPYREPEPSSPIHRALGSNFTKKPQTFLNFSSSPKPRGR